MAYFMLDLMQLILQKFTDGTESGNGNDTIVSGDRITRQAYWLKSIIQ